MCKYLPGIVPTKLIVPLPAQPDIIDIPQKLDSAPINTSGDALCSANIYPTKYIRL